MNWNAFSHQIYFVTHTRKLFKATLFCAVCSYALWLQSDNDGCQWDIWLHFSNWRNPKNTTHCDMLYALNDGRVRLMDGLRHRDEWNELRHTCLAIKSAFCISDNNSWWGFLVTDVGEKKRKEKTSVVNSSPLQLLDASSSEPTLWLHTYHLMCSGTYFWLVTTRTS